MTHADDLDHGNGSRQGCGIRFDEDGSVTLRRRFLGGSAFMPAGPARRLGWVSV